MMVGLQRIEVAGQRFVLLAEAEYERLCHDASVAVGDLDTELPAFPKADKNGRYPALQYARVSLARDLIRARRGARLTQHQLAQLAGVRQETLSRIETAKHTATPQTVDKIMQAIDSHRSAPAKSKRR